MNKSARVFSILAACVLGGTAFAASGPVPGQGTMDGRKMVTLNFRYDPRDLATRAGAERVYRRLVQAARRHCTIGEGRLADLRRVDARCLADLVDKAVDRTGSRQLAGVHAGAEDLRIAARR